MTGFWIFMLFSNLLIPFSMMCFGRYFSKKAPARINDWFGYRTARSTKNRDTWEFAHHYFGKLWFRGGGILLVFSILAMLPVYGKSIEFVGFYGGGLCMIQIVVMLIPIFLTESALKKKFSSEE